MSDEGFKHGHALTASVRRIVSSGPADMAVAYWGGGACERLGLPADLAGYRIACDAYSGFCSPTVLGALLKRGASIVDLSKLHAKVYLSASGMVVGSANASTRGLSVDEQEPYGLETGVLERDPSRIADARTWFGTIFDAGSPVEKTDIPAVKEAWDRQRSSRPLGMSLMEAILARSDLLTDRKLRVYTYTAEEPGEPTKARYKKSSYFDARRWEESRNYHFFWGEMPKSVTVGDELLCFEADGGRIVCEGAWKILDRIGNGEKTIWPAAPVDVQFSRGLGPRGEVNRLTAAAVRAGRLAVDGDPVSLPEFAAAVAVNMQEAEHLARIRNPEARAAYRLLVDTASELGLSVSYKSGTVPAVKWTDAEDRYVFSFIPNQKDLLFYVRDPALEADPRFASQVAKLGLISKRNPSGEETLRVGSPEDAEKLIAWLRGLLPLPKP